MSEMNGRIEMLPDPAALAHHVAEWMTAAALAAKDAFRVSLSGGSTPKALLHAAGLGRVHRAFPVGARLLVLGRRALRSL